MDLNLKNVLDKNIGYTYLNLSKKDIQIIKNMIIKNFNNIILKNNYSKKKDYIWKLFKKY